MPTAQKAKAPVKKVASVKKVEKAAAPKVVVVGKVIAKKATPTKKSANSVVRVKARSKCPDCLAEASSDKAFWVNNGPVISTLDGLRDALRGMSDEQFEYHTKRAGNDFARWVDEVLCHGTCAKKLSGAKTRDGAVRAIATCAC